MLAGISPKVGAAVSAVFLALAVLAAPAGAQDKSGAAGGSQGGAVFKEPKGYMRAPLPDVRGLMFLNPKKPAGMFAGYPNDGETADALRERLREVVAGMFIHQKDARLAWESGPLAPHAGDAKASAETAAWKGMEVQFVAYERTTGDRPLLYGYFAMRHQPSKGDDARFLDAEGRGVKEFEQFRQSLTK